MKIGYIKNVYSKSLYLKNKGLEWVLKSELEIALTAFFCRMYTLCKNMHDPIRRYNDIDKGVQGNYKECVEHVVVRTCLTETPTALETLLETVDTWSYQVRFLSMITPRNLVLSENAIKLLEINIPWSLVLILRCRR